MEQILTVLAGQPNCGKSTIFNMLTGAASMWPTTPV